MSAIGHTKTCVHSILSSWAGYGEYFLYSVTEPLLLWDFVGGLLKLYWFMSSLLEILIQQKYMIDIFNLVHVCQVPLQLSCSVDFSLWVNDAIQDGDKKLQQFSEMEEMILFSFSYPSTSPVFCDL